MKKSIFKFEGNLLSEKQLSHIKGNGNGTQQGESQVQTTVQKKKTK